MRFFESWGGFIWEHNSVWDYFKALLGRLIGAVIGIGILFLILLFFYWYGQTH